MPDVSLQNFPDYELIDSGDFYKLERFGQYILSRPEPQAIWNRSLPIEEWDAMWHAHFTRSKELVVSNKEDSGSWLRKGSMPDKWQINYRLAEGQLKFKLALTSFKHIGIFPEQAINWEYIHKNKNILQGQRALNLFAYTGGASLAFKASGADIIHLDSVKKNIEWSKENMIQSGLTDIRWLVEDALKFVQRESKRGNKYKAIILDPPAYGRGPDGEKWVLEDHLNELLFHCHKILASKDSLFIINLYSMGYSVTMLETLVRSHFKHIKEVEKGELVLEDRFGKKLPAGIFMRFKQ